MKKFKTVVIAVLAVIPAIFTAVRLHSLPATVAVHFGFDGTPDRYGSKYEAFILPAVLLIVYVVYLVIRKAVHKASAENTEKIDANMRIADTVLLCLYINFNIIDVFLLYSMAVPKVMRHGNAALAVLLSAIFGVLFIIIGNIMPKTRRNSWLGMRTKTAMSSDRNWYICNRCSGIAFVTAGFITVLSGIILRSMTAVFVMVITLIVTQVIAILCAYAKIKRE